MKCHSEKYSLIKMENHTVMRLKAIAKERGVRDSKSSEGRVDTRLGSGKISRTKKLHI